LAVIKDKRNEALFLPAYRHGLRASDSYPKQPDVIKLLRSYMRGRTASSPYLFISNRGMSIDRRTL
jgi:hypothetical protein